MDLPWRLWLRAMNAFINLCYRMGVYFEHMSMRKVLPDAMLYRLMEKL